MGTLTPISLAGFHRQYLLYSPIIELLPWIGNDVLLFSFNLLYGSDVYVIKYGFPLFCVSYCLPNPRINFARYRESIINYIYTATITFITGN